MCLEQHVQRDAYPELNWVFQNLKAGENQTKSYKKKVFCLGLEYCMRKKWSDSNLTGLEIISKVSGPNFLWCPNCVIDSDGFSLIVVLNGPENQKKRFWWTGAVKHPFFHIFSSKTFSAKIGESFCLLLIDNEKKNVLTNAIFRVPVMVVEKITVGWL